MEHPSFTIDIALIRDSRLLSFLCTNQSSFSYPPPPTCIARISTIDRLLQYDYYTTIIYIAQSYTTPTTLLPTLLSFVYSRHTPYDYTILVMTISYSYHRVNKGKGGPKPASAVCGMRTHRLAEMRCCSQCVVRVPGCELTLSAAELSVCCYYATPHPALCCLLSAHPLYLSVCNTRINKGSRLEVKQYLVNGQASTCLCTCT